MTYWPCEDAPQTDQPIARLRSVLALAAAEGDGLPALEMPEKWTPRQVAQFRQAWDEFMRSDEARMRDVRLAGNDG